MHVVDRITGACVCVCANDVETHAPGNGKIVNHRLTDLPDELFSLTSLRILSVRFFLS